ncbi:MAG: PIG-L family deacetylase [Deltaproteobacteria bacterium]|nr:PIG-L family deacetylase [Deltaproteobacteria bacterium]
MMSPPGSTTEIHARSVLVLAPHYDDEILGCGGLLARLVADGAAVRVLFLSDSSGGVEPVEDPEAYRSRRRQEAEAVAAWMKFTAIEHLDLPDGNLELALKELREALEEALERYQPELLLTPSPLEVTEDHRATFAALHGLLGSLRGSGPVMTLAQRLEVLVYEVNHPFYPELLVDVGDHLEVLAGAMERYPSQQERHDYWAAGLGLRRYRTLSLPPEIKAAEGYVSLRLKDFVTHSPSQLIRRLGGEPQPMEVREGPLVSVVVRTFDRPEFLTEALESLASNTYRQVEVVVVNDGGSPPVLSEDLPFAVRQVNLDSNQGRSAAANAGVEASTGDFVTFLDDDDLAAPEHLETLVGLVSAAGVRVAYTDAAVGVYELDGSGRWACIERRLPYSRDFDLDLLRLDNYIPFNTLLIERQLLVETGPFDTDLPFFEDWEMLLRLAEKTRFHHLPRVTCEYRHFRSGQHQIFGGTPRQRADFLSGKAQVLAKHGAALQPELVAGVVDQLRAEAVGLSEQGRKLRRELRGVRKEVAKGEGRYFRLNGELEALRNDHELLVESFQRQGEEEISLRQVIDDQTAHLGRTYGEIERLTREVSQQGEHLNRTYGEIERLNQLVKEMEASRAWRLHQWIQQRRKGVS